MIVFDLRCADAHVFEAWFGSSDDFAAQKARGLVACPICGSAEVEKAVMAPAVPAKGNRLVMDAERKQHSQKLQALRIEVEASCDYVGADFAREARSRFARPPADPETPPRGIYGQASLAQAADLIADGIPVAPLPFRPRRLADA